VGEKKNVEIVSHISGGEEGEFTNPKGGRRGKKVGLGMRGGRNLKQQRRKRRHLQKKRKGPASEAGNAQKKRPKNVHLGLGGVGGGGYCSQ